MKSRKLTFDRHLKPAEALFLEEFETPELRPGEVLLEILASPVNPADLNFIEGTYAIKPTFPATPGIECSARVVASRSEHFTEGEIVLPTGRIGAWADHAVAREEDLIGLPTQIDILQAAMLKVNPATAKLLLGFSGDLAQRDRVALNAANSGVGRCVVRLAARMGVRTICFLRNTELAPELTALGATHVFEDNEEGLAEAREALEGERVKLAFNAVGGESALRLMKLLGTGGTHVTYGAMGRKPLTIPNGPLIFNDIRVRGLWVTRWLENADRHEISETYAALARNVIAGELTQPVDSAFDLADFRKALARHESPGRNGKVLFAAESVRSQLTNATSIK